MEALVLWLGFLGAWLLFAGSIYQAALELQDEDIEIDRIRAAGARVEPARKTSVWLWLLPPLKVYLERRHKKEYQRRFIDALSHEDLEAIVSFRSKTSAWLFVAVGGICIACKESYELGEHYSWSTLQLIGAVITLLLLSILYLISSLIRAKKIVKTK